MVRKTRLRPPKNSCVTVMGAVILCTLALLFWAERTALAGPSASLASSSVSLASNSAFSSVDNGIALKKGRQDLRDRCAGAKTEEEVFAISTTNKQGFRLPSQTKEQPPQPQPRGDGGAVRCRSLVMDFGANVGDTSGHVIDTGMVNCERKNTKTTFVHFNVATKSFEDIKKRNPLTNQLDRLMSEFGGALRGPEDYCHYGVEGNPVFTKRLQDLEDYVMAIRPRPIQHMHFFTESVGAGEDGMTNLYLDTINTKQNFWGSSIFKGHQDVKKSADEANTTADTLAAPVMGYTIGTLMRKTLKAFAPDATEADKKGNHLVLKVDIEGGEYPLMHQAATEGTLCKFIKMGNQADLFIEFHSKKVTGDHEFAGKKTHQMKKTLTGCGVTFRSLEAWWS